MKALYIGVFVAAVWTYVCWIVYKAYRQDRLVAAAAVPSATATPPTSAGSTIASHATAVTAAGLDPKVLLLLPVFVFAAAAAADDGQKEKVECAVCLAELKEGEKERALPKCRHVFHRECIDAWFASHSTCPICRAVVNPEEDIDLDV